MPSIRVMDLVDGDNRRKELWKCIGKFQLQAWGIQEGNGMWYITTEEQEYERYFTEEVKYFFITRGFDLLPPAEFNSLRTIVVRQLDVVYRQKTTAEMIGSIEDQNPWTEVEEIAFLPSKAAQGIAKIRLKTWRQAQHALNEGLKIWEQTIPPKYIEQEVFTRIISCSNCFCYQHYVKDCNMPVRKRCAKCGETGHSRVACLKNSDYCQSCKSDEHNTFDRDCPLRKASLQERNKGERKKERNKAMSRHKSFQERNRKFNINKREDEDLKSLPSRAMAIIMTAVVSSIAINKRAPGSFQNTFDDILKYNRIPTVPLPSSVIMELTEGMTATSQGRRDTASSEEEGSDSYEDMVDADDVFNSSRNREKNRGAHGVHEDTAAAELKEYLEWKREEPSSKKKRDRSSTDHNLLSGIEDESTSSPTNIGAGTKKDKKKQKKTPALDLKTLRTRRVKLYFPTNYIERDGTINKRFVLRELMKTHLNLVFDKGPGLHPRQLIEEATKKDLNPEDYLEFEGLSPPKYQCLCEGHWSIVGMSSE